MTNSFIKKAAEQLTGQNRYQLNISELLAILDNENSRKQYRYLLIDNLVSVSNLNVLSIDNITDMLGYGAVNSLIRPDLSHDIARCPKLITLAKPNEKMDGFFLRYIAMQLQQESTLNKRYICSCIVSEFAPEDLSEKIIQIGFKLGRLIDVIFVPFYEPFKMQLLHDSNQICSDWLSSLLDCCSVYCYTSFTSCINSIKSLSYNPSVLDLFITEETKFFLKESKKLHFLSIAWLNLCEKQNRTFLDSDILMLSNFYRQGWIAGLANTNDLFSFSLIMMSHKNLLSNDEINKAINIAKDNPGSLADYFRQIELKK